MECCSSGKKMNMKTKQHLCTEFAFGLKKTTKETTALLKKSFSNKCLRFSALKKAFRGRQFCSDQELLTATQIFFNHLLEFQFCKTFDDKRPKPMQKCFWAEVAILERLKQKWRCWRLLKFANRLQIVKRWYLHTYLVLNFELKKMWRKFKETAKG